MGVGFGGLDAVRILAANVADLRGLRGRTRSLHLRNVTNRPDTKCAAEM